MTEPLVSVKMITYNHAPYIARAIEGVLQQKTTFPFELVIGEDCSTDGTREIVFDHQKKYPNIVRVVTSEKNTGMKKNSYRTAKACRGKYIAFCEGDDYWHHPYKLQKQAHFLEDHSDCGLVYSDYDCYFVEKQQTVKSYNRYKKRNLPVNPTIVDFVLGRGGILGGLLTCTVVVRRCVLEQIAQADPFLYQESSFLMGDTQAWAEIAHISKIKYIDESLATHNILPESAAKSNDRAKCLKFYRSGTEMLLYLCEKYGLPEEARRFQKRRWCDYSFELAFVERNLSLAKQIINQCHNLSLKQRIKYASMHNGFAFYLLTKSLSIRKKILGESEGFTP